MRPGRFHPGNTRKATSEGCGVSTASMRPGRFHPGNAGERRFKALQLLHASMRPGRFHPGNSLERVLLVRQDRRFNEAGAFPPRKYAEGFERFEFQIEASMRPGRFHPGNSAGVEGRVASRM